MRLINIDTMKIEEFFSNIPEYAILSHTWEEGEVSFQEYQDPEIATLKPGWKKISEACQQAEVDGLSYCWIDTCCIDKTSSAELSEAINSMFEWYHKSKICYVFLADMDIEPPEEKEWTAEISAKFCSSKWFTRGWTLQELLAPETVFFFNADWTYIGTKRHLKSHIIKATGIESFHLDNNTSIWGASIAKRMSWMAKRETTRPEDAAYCLFGIFEVNMPLLYGEGSRAFVRLQEEILKRSDDQSILCWDRISGIVDEFWSSVLAPCPSVFMNSGNFAPSYVNDEVLPIRPFKVTNAGLSIWISIIATECPNVVLGVLQAGREDVESEEYLLCIPLEITRGFRRITRPSKPFFVLQSYAKEPQKVFISCTTAWADQRFAPKTYASAYPGSFGMIIARAAHISENVRFEIVQCTQNVVYSKHLGQLDFLFGDPHTIVDVGFAVFKYTDLISSREDWFCIAVRRPISTDMYWTGCYTTSPSTDISKIMELVQTAHLLDSYIDRTKAYGTIATISLDRMTHHSSHGRESQNFQVAYVASRG